VATSGKVTKAATVASVPSYVPAAYRTWVAEAAASTGLPTAVVAAQIDDESGFDPNATSPAGAEGIAQFLPSTFKSYASGSPYNAGDELDAYIGYMSSLLKSYNGNIRNALAAYNAGPGNLAAGYGYADAILGRAGLSSTATSAGTPTGSATGGSGGYSLSRPGGETSSGSQGGQSSAAQFQSDLAALTGTPRTAPSNPSIDASYGEDVSFWGDLTAPFKWYWQQYTNSWNELEGDIKGPEEVISDGVSFMDFMTKFALNPFQWMRGVEFITGIVMMGFGIRALSYTAQRVSGDADRITRSIVAATPIGRQVRMARGRRQGTREGQVEHARLQARRASRQREAARARGN
jgi:hypothetical protein